MVFRVYDEYREKKTRGNPTPPKVQENNVVAILLAYEHVYFPCLSKILRPRHWQVVFFSLLPSHWSLYTAEGLWDGAVKKGLEFSWRNSAVVWPLNYMLENVLPSYLTEWASPHQLDSHHVAVE